MATKLRANLLKLYLVKRIRACGTLAIFKFFEKFPNLAQDPDFAPLLAASFGGQQDRVIGSLEPYFSPQWSDTFPIRWGYPV